ncbi:MAG: GAF domain-containing protein [Anaerolineae bacterium]|nr:GAF domain-containing protein [Anaerolineae bacterium]
MVGFSIFALITLSVVAIIFIASQAATKIIGTVTEVRAPSELALARAQSSLLRMQASVRGYLVLSDVQNIDDYNRAKETFELNLAQLEELSAKWTDDDAQRLKELKDIYEAWVPIPNRLFELHDSPSENQPALRMESLEFQPLREELVDEINLLVELQRQRESPMQSDELLADMADFQLSLLSMASALRAYVLTGDLTFKFEYFQHLDTNSSVWRNLQAKKDLLPDNQQILMDSIAQTRQQLLALAPQIVEIIEGERVYEDLYLFKTEVSPQAEHMLQLLDIMTTDQGALLEADLNRGRQSLTNVQTQTLVSGVLALILGLGMGFMFKETIIGPIRRLTSVAEQFAVGNLTVQASVESDDEIGQLANTFNVMSNKLGKTVANLEKRGEQIETLVTVSQQLTSILDLNELVQQVVTVIKEKFDYYHVHIYLLDQQEKTLIMTAGYGQAGAEMKARGHSIQLNAPTSLVARAARNGEVVRVNNVREAPDWLPNELLPNTYSEMAVPIVLEDQVVGVLDVQQDAIGGLDEGDESLVRSLANQVAVAIRNARLFSEVEKRFAEAREAQKKYVEQAWQARADSEKEYRYQKFSHALEEETAQTLKQLAYQEDQASVVPADVAENYTAVIAPIRFQDQVIGTMAFQEPNLQKRRDWSEQELALVQAIADQVAQTAENLRLFDETRKQASRERLIGQISNKLRQASDMETLLKLGLEELSGALGSKRAFIQLGSLKESNDSASNLASIPAFDSPDSQLQNEVTSTNGYKPMAKNGSGE